MLNSLIGIIASSGGAAGPKATGGTVTDDGTYWYHTFTSSGTFTPLASLTADCLVIAGGGGGGGTNIGGGGGAGGLLYSASQSLSVTPYTVTIGAGGVGSTTLAAKGLNGSNSQFGSITASVGGGGGGSSLNGPGASGGSGGGGSNSAGSTGGSPTSGQGYAGGTSDDNTMYPAGGGGGSGAVGTNGNGTNNARAGGSGLNTYSSFASATSTGASGYYAGGGASGALTPSGSLITTRTNGGGGFNSSTIANANGLVNTGSGAAGFSFDGGATTYPAGTGGSGICIVRYLK
jgi:hypothetical protein